MRSAEEGRWDQKHLPSFTQVFPFIHVTLPVITIIIISLVNDEPDARLGLNYSSRELCVALAHIMKISWHHQHQITSVCSLMNIDYVNATQEQQQYFIGFVLEVV